MQYTVAVTWGVCLTHSGQAQKFSAVSAGRDEVMAVLCLVTYILKYYIFAFMLFFVIKNLFDNTNAKYVKICNPYNT
jgi:large-conductance mechanosensitive channel